MVQPYSHYPSSNKSPVAISTYPQSEGNAQPQYPTNHDGTWRELLQHVRAERERLDALQDEQIDIHDCICINEQDCVNCECFCHLPLDSNSSSSETTFNSSDNDDDDDENDIHSTNIENDTFSDIVVLSNDDDDIVMVDADDGCEYANYPDDDTDGDRSFDEYMSCSEQGINEEDDEDEYEDSYAHSESMISENDDGVLVVLAPCRFQHVEPVKRVRFVDVVEYIEA